MRFRVVASHRDLPTWKAWALERPTPLFGIVVPYTTIYHESKGTIWDERSGAEAAMNWLNRDNRVPMFTGISCSIEEVE